MVFVLSHIIYIINERVEKGEPVKEKGRRKGWKVLYVKKKHWDVRFSVAC